MNMFAKFYIKTFLLSLLTGISVLCFPQQNIIDSLKNRLQLLNAQPSGDIPLSIKGVNKNEANDTMMISCLNELAWELKTINPDTSIILANQALNILAQYKEQKANVNRENDINRSISKTYNGLGVYNCLKGNYMLALDYLKKSLRIREQLKDEKGISSILGNMGSIYKDLGDYPKAIETHLEALKLAEKAGDLYSAARQLANLGNDYNAQKNANKALEYYSKALEIGQQLKNKNLIGAMIGNIGTFYHSIDDFPKALENYFKALKIDYELQDKDGISSNLANIANVYCNQAGIPNQKKEISDSLYNESLNYYLKALKIARELGDNDAIARILCSIGDLYVLSKKYDLAKEYLHKAEALSKAINSLNLMKESQESLSQLYTSLNQPDEALKHYKKFIDLKDSLFNEENTKKTVRSEMNFEFEKKQAIEKAEHEKINAIATQEKQKQKIILILITCFLAVVAVFASFMFNRWRITKKQKMIIEKQKEKIVDSITYAQRIQQSILPDEKEIHNYFPNSFVYYLPKDIVSGDFYWCSKIDDKIVIAAIDCTGHGVPGAFMSMVGNTLLNQIVNEKKITTPSEILLRLNTGIYESLHQEKQDAASSDGMEIALCSIDPKNKLLQYAGAGNPLFIIANGQLEVVEASSFGIGGENKISKNEILIKKEYINHSIPLKDNMHIYLCTDGYTDQFGGPAGKKFTSKRLKELLVSISGFPMIQQKEKLNNEFQKWKGNTQQTDDITIIGIRIA